MDVLKRKRSAPVLEQAAFLWIWIGRPEFQEVAVQVVKIIRFCVHPFKVGWTVDIDLMAAHVGKSGIQLVAGDFQGKMDGAPSWSVAFGWASLFFK